MVSGYIGFILVDFRVTLTIREENTAEPIRLSSLAENRLLIEMTFHAFII